MNKSLKDLLAKQYLEDGIDSIKKEAVFSLECIFDLMPMEQLCNQSRPMALAYLALTQEEPANEPLTLDEVARAIREVVDNGGCPPDKDCAENQNCHKCLIEWLTDAHKPEEVQVWEIFCFAENGSIQKIGFMEVCSKKMSS